MQVWSLGWEDPLEEDTATHSSILAWRIPWIEELGRLQSIGSHRVGHDRYDYNQFLGILFTKKKKSTYSVTTFGVLLWQLWRWIISSWLLYTGAYLLLIDSRGETIVLIPVRCSRKQFWALRSLSFHPGLSGEHIEKINTRQGKTAECSRILRECEGACLTCCVI